MKKLATTTTIPTWLYFLIGNRNFHVGLTFGLGLTAFWQLAIFLLIVDRRRVLKDFQLPHYTVLILAGLILWSAATGPQIWNGIMSAAALLTVFMATRNFSADKSFWFGVGIVSVVSVLFASAQQIDNPTGRFWGVADSVTVFGLSHSALIATPVGFIAAAAIGLANTRSGALAAFFIWAMRPTRKTFVAIILMVVVLLIVDGAAGSGRFTPVAIDRDIELRQTTLGTADGQIIDPTFANDPELRLWGYGYGGYNLETGRQRPHNIFVSSVYEMGILAIPFWYFVLLGLGYWGNPGWRIILALVPFIILSMFNDDLYARPEMWFALSLFWIGHKSHYLSRSELRTVRESGTI